MEVTEELLLNKCKTLIEEQLQWGNSDIWTNQDFETLSEKIEEVTKVNLSPVTLKRIWGKIKYESKPTITTLDTLVQFIGVENWRTFKLKNSAIDYTISHPNENDHVSESYNIDQKEIRHVKQSFKTLLIPASVLLVASAVWGFYPSIKNTTSDTSPDSYAFSSSKIEPESIPNSVIFKYDATAAKDDDTVYIQQSWDERLRQRVDKNEKVATSIYYYPGYFVSKLVVNNEIVKQHGIHIRTNGWLPLVEQPNVPVYFKEHDAINSTGVMTLPLARLAENSIPMQPQTPWVAFHNSREFGNLKSDNFIFETELKNDYNEGAGICQNIEIHIRWEGGVLIVPLSIKGCVSNLGLFDVEGRKADTSLLGCDFSDWVQLKVMVKDRKGELFVNGSKAYDLNLDVPPANLVAITYRFQGTGSVNSVKLSTVDGDVVYENDF